jgi:hypothetical protein
MKILIKKYYVHRTSQLSPILSKNNSGLHSYQLFQQIYLIDYYEYNSTDVRKKTIALISTA